VAFIIKIYFTSFGSFAPEQVSASSWYSRIESNVLDIFQRKVFSSLAPDFTHLNQQLGSSANLETNNPQTNRNYGSHQCPTCNESSCGEGIKFTGANYLEIEQSERDNVARASLQ
jgi:hypothetical protein